MVDVPPESQNFAKDFSGQPSFWPVDRSTEVDQLLEKIDKNRGKPVFVLGRRDVGKTSLLTYHVKRCLADRGDDRTVRFGRLRIDGTATIVFDESDTAFDETLRQEIIVCVDHFHHLFALSAREQLKFLDRLHAQINADDSVASVVFLLDDDEIGDLMALNALRPDFVDLMFQVRGVDLVESVRKIIDMATGSSDWLPDEVLQHVADDALQLMPDAKLGISPRLPAVIAYTLITAHENAHKEKFGVSSYVENDRLQGLLEGYVTAEINRLAETGLATPETLWRIMDEMVIADPVSGVSDFDALAARLNIPSRDCAGILETIRNHSGIIRKIGSGAYRPAPSQLHTVLRALTRERRQQLGLLQAEVAEHAESGMAHGTALPLPILKRVLRNQYDLHFDQRTTQFVVDWVLRTRSCSLGDARYWLSRIEDNELRLDIITNGAFDPDESARLKATQLLLEYNVPEAREILLNLVIQDPDPEVHASAIEQLATAADESTREKLYAAARTQGSNYRINAVQALTIFPDKQTVDLLIEIADMEDQPELSRAAMEVMASIPNDEAVAGLTGIALQADDGDRRETAGSALSAITGMEHIGKVLNAIFGWQARRLQQGSKPSAFVRLLKGIGNFWLGLFSIFLNIYIPGVTLLLVRQYRSGAIFVLLGLFTYSYEFFEIGYVYYDVFMVMRAALVIASLVWTGSVLLRSDTQLIWRLSFLQRVVRGQILWGLVLTAVTWEILFFGGFAWFPLPHGIFHLMVKNWRRAARIFSLQLLAFGFWFVGQYQSGIIYDDTPVWLGFSEADINAFASQLYLAAWYVLSFGTLLWDVFGALLGKLVMARWFYRRGRRKDLLNVLLTEKAYVNYLALQVCGPDAKAANRSAALLISHGDRIPPPYLLHYAETDNRKLRHTLEKSLAKATSLSAVSHLADTIPHVTGLKQTMIMRALTNRPTPQSLQAFKEHAAEVPARERKRIYWGRSKYAASMLGTPLGVTATIMSFWVLFLIWEGSNTLLDPYRPMEKYVVRNCEQLVWPSQRGYDINRQLSWAQSRASTAFNMAELMLESGMDEDRILKTEKVLSNVHQSRCEQVGDDADLLIRLAALGGLAHLASRHAAGQQSLPSDLSGRPAETISLGLDNPRPEIRSIALTTLGKLIGLQPTFALFEPNERDRISESLGRQLGDQKLAIAQRQSAISLLQSIGGAPAVKSLTDFVLRSDSTYAGSRQRSGDLSRKVRSGLGISGQLRTDAALAQQSIDAMAGICTPTAAKSLKDIASSKGGNLGKSAEEALKKCEGKSLPVSLGQESMTIADEVDSLADAFARGEYQSVATSAEYLVHSGTIGSGQKEELGQLRLLAGRANFKLASLEPALTLEYWREAEEHLDSYVRDELELGLTPDTDAVHELAQSRLGLARSYMDKGWSEGLTQDQRVKEFAQAKILLEKVMDDQFLALFRSVDADRVDGVMSTVWAFYAAALIDGEQKYSDAKRFLDLSLGANEQFAWAHYLQALANYNLHNDEVAIDETLRSLELDPRYELPYRLIYQLREQINAKSVLTDLKTRFPDTPWPNFYLAVVHHEYLAPQRSDTGALDEYNSAFQEMSEYARKVDTINDPLLNIQWLELAITSGNLEREEIWQVRETLRKQSVGMEHVQIVSSYFLALAELHASTAGLTTPEAQQVTLSGNQLLDELLQAYRSLEDGAEPLWETTGIRHYLEHCREWQRCKFDQSLADELVRIAEVFEQPKSLESVAVLEKSVESLKKSPIHAKLPEKGIISPAA